MNKSDRHLLRGIMTTIVATALAGASTLPAAAASTPDRAPHQAARPLEVSQVVVPMHVVKYDAQIAAAHGYEIRTTPDNVQYSVPIGTVDTAEHSRATSPRGVVIDDCGNAFLFMSSTGYWTGFNVNADVLWHKWGVSIIGNYTTQDDNLDGGPGDISWDASRLYQPQVRGYSVGVVNGGSYAQLINGATCAAGAPSDIAVVP